MSDTALRDEDDDTIYISCDCGQLDDEPDKDCGGSIIRIRPSSPDGWFRIGLGPLGREESIFLSPESVDRVVSTLRPSSAITVTLDTVIAEIERRILSSDIDMVAAFSPLQVARHKTRKEELSEFRDYLIALRDGAGTARAAEGGVR